MPTRVGEPVPSDQCAQCGHEVTFHEYVRAWRAFQCKVCDCMAFDPEQDAEHDASQSLALRPSWVRGSPKASRAPRLPRAPRRPKAPAVNGHGRPGDPPLLPGQPGRPPTFRLGGGMRLPAIHISITIGHKERSWYSAGHDAMLQWNRRELAHYREWVRALPSVTCNRVCGHNWSWPLARANGHTIGPMCTICHTTRREP